MLKTQRAKISAVILAGGFSSRMGQDKALLQIGHRTCVGRVVSQVLQITNDVWIVRRPDQSLLDEGQVIVDIHPGQGPLAGMEVGLLHIHEPICFVLSVDLPLVRVELLQFLYEQMQDDTQCDAVIPEYEGRLYPLLGVYRQTLQPMIAEMLRQNKRRVFDLINAIPVRVCTHEQWKVYDPLAVSFLMMNTMDEMKHVMDLIEEGGLLS